MNVLILGSTGILGNTLNIFLKKKKINLFSISRKKTNNNNLYLKDFKNFKKLEKIIKTINPDYIVNCLGITHYHKSYKNKKETEIINSLLPIYLSKFCLRKKIYLIHISTDCVYSGTTGNYSEKSRKKPKNIYAKTKSNGEIKNLYTSTIRTSFIGPEIKSNNQLLSWFLNQKNEINGFNKVFFSGLTSLELSNIIYTYFLKKKFLYNKILNIGGPKISKYNLLKLISKIFKINININKYPFIKIDRSLNSNKFISISGYKKKTWVSMVKKLKKFMLINNFKF